MNTRKTIILLFAALAFSCGDDASENNPVTAAPCGSGVAISDGASTACVYHQELIEEGFSCPDLLPHGFLLSGGGVACVNGQEMPPGLGQALLAEGYSPDEPSCFEPDPGLSCFYGDPMACSDVGCSDMIIISFQNADGTQISSAFQGTAQFHGTTIEFACSTGDPTGNGYGCFENTVTFSGIATEIALDVVDLDTGRQFQGTVDLTPQTIYPNGEHCPGECEQATASVTMEGMACTEIGCSDSVDLELLKDGAPVISVTGSVDLNTEVIEISCVVGDEIGTRYRCLNGRLSIFGIGPEISLDLLDAEGARFMGTIALSPQPVYPNGEHCPSECEQASETVNFQ